MKHFLMTLALSFVTIICSAQVTNIGENYKRWNFVNPENEEVVWYYRTEPSFFDDYRFRVICGQRYMYGFSEECFGLLTDTDEGIVKFFDSGAQQEYTIFDFTKNIGESVTVTIFAHDLFDCTYTVVDKIYEDDGTLTQYVQNMETGEVIAWNTRYGGKRGPISNYMEGATDPLISITLNDEVLFDNEHIQNTYYTRCQALMNKNNDDTQTYVNNVHINTDAIKVYDMQGRRVYSMKPNAVYIVNGKKYLNKN